jgi:outer membrane protein OmpA-like peptidoglycan-associated protein
VLLSLALSGCAVMRDREWGTCAIAGGILGAAVGATAGGVAVNNTHDHPANGERGAAIASGILGGGLLGALAGHALCDPVKPMPTPPPPPPPPAPPAKIVTLEGANFDTDKAVLKPAGKEKLDVAVRAMKDQPSMHVSIEGHCDSTGSHAHNMKLSQARADSAKAYLVSQGIEPSRISTEGFGETRPVADNGTAAGRAQNRRVELIAK